MAKTDPDTQAARFRAEIEGEALHPQPGRPGRRGGGALP